MSPAQEEDSATLCLQFLFEELPVCRDRGVRSPSSLDVRSRREEFQPHLADAFSEPSWCLLFFPAPPAAEKAGLHIAMFRISHDELMINTCKLKFQLSMVLFFFPKGLAATKTCLVGGNQCRSLSLLLDSVLNRL